MTKYNNVEIESFKDFLQNLRNERVVVLFVHEINSLVFNFGIIKSNNSDSDVVFHKIPYSFLSIFKELNSIMTLDVDITSKVYARKNVWINIKAATLELMEAELNQHFSIRSNKDYRFNENKIVVGPCKSIEFIQSKYQFVFCDFLDEIEDRITRRHNIKIRHWTDDFELICEGGLAIDTKFINKIEYLMLENGNLIRLDRIYDIRSI